MGLNSRLFLMVNLLAFLWASSTFAEEEKTPFDQNIEMTAELLIHSISNYADDVEVKKNLISFRYKKIPLYCIFDSKADRMRIISPIAEVGKVPHGMLATALEANYHTVLDARYAVGNGIIYSAFIHPLSPLTPRELKSAIEQVFMARMTFGDTFTSGALIFPEQSGKKTPKKVKQNTPRT